jgi:hypothetical protein
VEPRAIRESIIRVRITTAGLGSDSRFSSQFEFSRAAPFASAAADKPCWFSPGLAPLPSFCDTAPVPSRHTPSIFSAGIIRPAWHTRSRISARDTAQPSAAPARSVLDEHENAEPYTLNLDPLPACCVVEGPRHCFPMRSSGTHFGQSRERRAAVRYFVFLRVELWPVPPPKGVHPFFFTTTDVSTRGFYFLSARHFDVGTKVNFRIIFPRELTGGFAELIRGLARCVRVENALGSGVGLYGVGAEIELVKPM